MINEIFLEAAVAIRRQAIEMFNEIDSIEARLLKSKDFLAELEKRAIKFQKDAEDKRRKMINEENKPAIIQSKVNEFLDILKSIEDERESIDKFVDDKEKKKVKLKEEEDELWRQIKTKHPNVDEKDIINTIHERLKREGLL